MTGSLLQMEKVEVVYKRTITATQGISFSVADRQIVALLGTNGAANQQHCVQSPAFSALTTRG